MSAGCWKCGTATRPLELFCPADSCGAVQSLELHQINAFDLFRVDHYYDLDQKALETNFKEIQKQLHPDKFTTKSTPEREASNTTSSTANQAYQILRSPISRAEYMLKESFGIDFDETKSYEDSELMMEVFDLRESIQESEEGEELQSLLLQLRAEVQEQSKVFAHNMTESGRSEEERDKAAAQRSAAPVLRQDGGGDRAEVAVATSTHMYM
eukprot:CAMPEP_0173239196 /NCGR_PEP_ID=MMETSP1142-20121109/13075_1 /TAXON_ID=483371 /ORGANISM="non described non described, Strain CCMP2298" /LENGTH=211 /DNA_ID=CAMNT_0014170177 /DNA_START=66 /DNA_END=700 /DNA_ORIENTATION=+